MTVSMGRILNRQREHLGSGDLMIARVRQRILDYNEDDCRATRFLLDGIRSLAA